MDYFDSINPPEPQRSQAQRCETSGKVKFRSETEARRHFRNKKARLRAYRCPNCKGWHLTKAVY